MSETKHDFYESLAKSHEAEDLPFWEEVYRKAFPTMLTMANHRKDGQHQRNGIDRSVTLENAKQIFIDEKTRWRNKKTGMVYEDIALEYLSDAQRQVPGWVCKPLMADYIAYAIAPLGKCYLLPVVQLQQVWLKYGAGWVEEGRLKKNGRRIIPAENETGNREWTTLSVNVTVDELFPKIGACLRVEFSRYDPEQKPTEPPKLSIHSEVPESTQKSQKRLF